MPIKPKAAKRHQCGCRAEAARYLVKPTRAPRGGLVSNGKVVELGTRIWLVIDATDSREVWADESEQGAQVYAAAYNTGEYLPGEEISDPAVFDRLAGRKVADAAGLLVERAVYEAKGHRIDKLPLGHGFVVHPDHRWFGTLAEAKTWLMGHTA